MIISIFLVPIQGGYICVTLSAPSDLAYNGIGIKISIHCKYEINKNDAAGLLLAMQSSYYLII